MKTNLYQLLSLTLVIIYFGGCSKKGDVKPPEVSPLFGLATLSVQSITATSAYVDGSLPAGNDPTTMKAWGGSVGVHSIHQLFLTTKWMFH